MFDKLIDAKRSLTTVQKVVRFIRKPTNDNVFAVADAMLMWSPNFLRVRDPRFFDNPRVVRALEDQPRLGPIDLDALLTLPEGTLGREFAHHMRSNHLDPSDLQVVPNGTPDQYVRAHLYETHDIWHVVLDIGTDAAGELGVQAFYLAQVPAPVVTALIGGGMFNTAFANFDDMPARITAIVRGWLVGKRAKPLFGIRWDEWWSRPLDEIRRELGIDLEAVDRILDGYAPSPA